jgi:hypothetical protein
LLDESRLEFNDCWRSEFFIEISVEFGELSLELELD